MRVIIDATLLCRWRHTKGGQQRYARELIKHLDTVETDGEYVIWFNFTHPANMPLYRAVLADLSRTRLSYRPVLCRVPPQLLRPLRVPIEAFTGRADVFHAPYSACPSTWRARRVVTIHDLAYFDHPELFNQAIDKWKREVTTIVRRATLIITVSEYVRGEIIERLGVPPDRVRVIYHGVSSVFHRTTPAIPFEEIRTRFGIRGPYVLFVSTVQPNKNVMRLLEAFDLLRRSELRGWQLVIAGQPGWLTESVFSAVEARGLREDVVFTGFVDDEVLAGLYRQSEAFVLPSLAEGFGIPAIEAMACGTPVVASKTGALPEIVGDAGVLIDPFSAEDIARGICEAATDQTARGRLIARGRRRASLFRWERTARETVAAYRDAMRTT
jgi:glycosyltransferase involved in cell wall biosynthesis